MKVLSLALLITLTLVPLSRAADARFFRVAGPVACTITAFSADGYMTWTNDATNAIFTVQAAGSLVGPSNWVDYVRIPVTNSVNSYRLIDPNPPAGMAFIPSGVFTIGDTLDGMVEAIPISVIVSAFYMDVNLVSLSQWQSVFYWATNHGYGFRHAGLGKSATHPVVVVDWFDCMKWSNARSMQEGLEPTYFTDASFTQVFTNGDQGTRVYLNLTNNGYRLATEAEWERAARGGLSGKRFPWGNTISESQANYFGVISPFTGGDSYDLGPNGYNAIGSIGGTSPATSPVGSFAANGYGLYDMAGNVWQWCWDWYATPYGQPTTNNPTGPAEPLTWHVVRGGWWDGLAHYARCAVRGVNNAAVADSKVGFRCVRR